MMTGVRVTDAQQNQSAEEMPKKTFTAEEEEQAKRFKKSTNPPLILGQLTAGALIFLVLTDVIDFSKIVNVGVNDLIDVQSRIGYVFKYQTTGLLWIIRCIIAVIWVRVRSPAMDPTAGAEHLLEKPRNVLNNSFEQFVLSMVSQLILVQYLNSEHTVKYIPALSQMFILGRLTYWLGYPKYRHFGFMLNVVPLLVTMTYCTYKFYSDYF